MNQSTQHSARRSRVWLALRWLVFWPAMILMLLHLLMTGSPIPLWSFQSLRHPVPVETVTESHLVLAGGTRITLPYIRRIPASSLLLQAAIKDGVEIADDGEVVGLLWMKRICGNDPVAWCKVRINLTDLSGAILPEGIEPGIPEYEFSGWLESFPFDSRPDVPAHFSAYSNMRVRRVGEKIDEYLRNRGDSSSGP